MTDGAIRIKGWSKAENDTIKNRLTFNNIEEHLGNKNVILGNKYERK